MNLIIFTKLLPLFSSIGEIYFCMKESAFNYIPNARNLNVPLKYIFGLLYLENKSTFNFENDIFCNTTKFSHKYLVGTKNRLL